MVGIQRNALFVVPLAQDPVDVDGFSSPGHPFGGWILSTNWESSKTNQLRGGVGELGTRWDTPMKESQW